jgi:hypothetical protein
MHAPFWKSGNSREYGSGEMCGMPEVAAAVRTRSTAQQETKCDSPIVPSRRVAYCSALR